MLDYLQLRALVSVVRAVNSFFGATRRHLQYQTDWERAWGQWTKEYTIPSSIGSPDIRIRVWEPSVKKREGRRPVHINFQASGYIIDMFGTDSDFCQRLANELDITVLDCDYAKAPEYPFPHAYTDAADILKHVFQQGDTYDLSNVTVGGFSAGAGLGFALVGNEELGKSIKAIVGLYPWVDVLEIPEDAKPGPPGSTALLVEGKGVRISQQAYAQPPHSVSDVRISPALMSDDALKVAYKGRKVCIVTAELDALQPQGTKFADLLRGVGVDVVYEKIKDVGHFWDKSNRIEGWEAERKNQAYALVFKFFRDVYGN